MFKKTALLLRVDNIVIEMISCENIRCLKYARGFRRPFSREAVYT